MVARPRARAQRRGEASHPAAPASGRVPSIDALRGVAIVAMIAYHFAFDLRFFGVTRSDFEHDPFWLASRGAIVASFLALAGVSAVLADRAGIDTWRFARRIGVIVLCALAVSVASYVVFPRTFIYFGVLHCIAVSLVIARPLVRFPLACAVLGVLVIIAGLVFAHPMFDQRWTSWIGFTTGKPATQDYVPLFPWLGVLLLGVAAGHALAANGFRPLESLTRTPTPLRAMGRHSLAIYMVHQPMLMALLWAALKILRS